MVSLSDWLYNEYKQIGKDYNSSDEVAVYDESHAKFRDAIKESNEILDRLFVQSGESLIDFGCGTGALAIQASLRGLRVFAVDISQAMLSCAKSKALKSGAQSISFLNSGFLNYQHSAEPADYITSSFSFHHLPDYWKGIALKRMHKMLSDDGLLYVQDVIISEKNSIENINAFIKSQEDLGGDFLKVDAVEHFRDEFSTYDWVLEGMLDRSGFAIQSKESFDGLVSRYACNKKRA